MSNKETFTFVWQQAEPRPQFGTDSYLSGDYSNNRDEPEYLVDESGRMIAHVQKGFLGATDAYVVGKDVNKINVSYRYNCEELGTFQTREMAKTAVVTELLSRINPKRVRKPRKKKEATKNWIGPFRLDDLDFDSH